MNGDSTGGNRGLPWDLLLTGPGISQGVRFESWRSCLDAPRPSEPMQLNHPPLNWEL